jgi:hypothetical protein
VSSLDALMGTQEVTRGTGRPKGYAAVDGKRVPSVTTILNRFKESGGLVYAANQVGLEGKTLDEAWYSAKSVGGFVHKAVEAQLHGEPAPDVPEEYLEQTLAAFGAWQEWWDSSRFTVVATEVPLVSERYLFGGTIDSLLRDQKGRLSIGDWKSSSGIFTDMLLQLAAYGLLWEENEDEKLEGGFHLVRFSKTEGDLEHRHFQRLDEEQAMFIHLRSAYELDKNVKKRAR